MLTNNQLISVIFTTYNSTVWLEKVLWGFHFQLDKHFEIVIADDGSTADTGELIEKFRQHTHIRINHIWQEDNGFQKCRIMNKALLEAKGEYVIFTDGDCIPRKDFVSVHRQHAKTGYYLSGGYFKLPMSISQTITKEDIKNGDAFSPEWLLAHGLKKTLKLQKLSANSFSAYWLNHLTPTKRTWNGHNASGWKNDLFAVNGYDERMQYGGQDCELGFRLRHSGIKAKQIRYSAIVIHLDHSRGYATPDAIANSARIKKETLKNKSTYTQYGLSQYLDTVKRA
ncbi:glycosyltransferase family 2 protein [Thalassotalea fusca]